MWKAEKSRLKYVQQKSANQKSGRALKKHIGKPARLVKLSFVEKKGNVTVATVIFSIVFVKSF